VASGRQVLEELEEALGGSGLRPWPVFNFSV